MVRSYFEHNTITNERTGRGLVEVRAPNPRYHEEIKKEIKDIGIQAVKAKPSHQGHNKLVATLK